MPLSQPWDLVTADPVPDSVEWWALSGVPSEPVDLARVFTLKLGDLRVQVEYERPEKPQPGRVAWRAFTARIFPPEHGPVPLYRVAALAFVENAGGTKLLGVFTLTVPFVVETGGVPHEVAGFIQVSKYQ